MGQKNGYFQIVTHENKTFVRLFPQSEGGEPILITELRDYLAFNKYQADIVALNNIIMSLTEPVEYPLMDSVSYAISEYFTLKVSEDRMKAVARFYPASTGGQALTKEELLNDLAHKGIKVGINESVIDAYIKNKEYCTDIVVAEGVAPKRGRDASIEYFFNTDPDLRPTLNPDGTVDFFNLNTISKCTKGMILATLTPEVPGERGARVTGEPILPPDVRKMRLLYASNIELTEDGLSIRSKVDGHVSLVDDKVFVSDVYEVVDVDTSTGNIEYQGNILVKGNIKSGFCVEADGDIEVRGVVEGALVKAGGNIIVARGINGMNKGVVNAGGNVVARFIENAQVTAGGFVQTEAIMHSKVNATGDVAVNGKKGFIVGGSVRSLGNVEAKTIGSDMGGETEIEVGTDPKAKLKAQQLEKMVAESKEKIAKMEPILATFMKRIKEKAQLTPDQLRYFKQLSEQYKVEKENYQEYCEEFEKASEGLNDSTKESAIFVSQFVYPGTKFTISEVSQVISSTCQHSRFVREGADIRIKPL